MKEQTRNLGFTLVELIIVLVILAILIALLVPALTGYIKKADEKKALAECRMAVEAAQTILSEKYGQGGLPDMELDPASINPDVTKLAEVNGEISGYIRFNENAKITYLEYIYNKKIIAVYDIAHDPNYYITTVSSKLYGYINDANDFARRMGNADRSSIMSEIEKQYGGLLKVDPYFAARTTAYQNTTLYWRPYYLKDENNPPNYSTFLYAGQSSSGWNQWRANLFYANGTLYEVPDGYLQMDSFKNFKTMAELEARLKSDSNVKICN